MVHLNIILPELKVEETQPILQHLYDFLGIPQNESIC